MHKKSQKFSKFPVGLESSCYIMHERRQESICLQSWRKPSALIQHKRQVTRTTTSQRKLTESCFTAAARTAVLLRIPSLSQRKGLPRKNTSASRAPPGIAHFCGGLRNLA